MLTDFTSADLDHVYESPLNTRKHFDEDKLAELTASVKAKGVLVPLIVRDNVRSPGKTAQRYEILAGARRYRAAKAAELARVPVRIVDMTDDEAVEIIVIENLQREDVHPLEEATGFQELLKRPGYDVRAIAAKVGKSETYVYQRLKLVDLIAPAQEAFVGNAITPGHAVLLARLQPGDQKDALQQCFRQDWDRNGGGQFKRLVSVKELESWIGANVHLDLNAAVFDTADAELLATAGACTTCPKRSGYVPALFADIAKKDTCTDRACFKAKLEAHVVATTKELRAEGRKPVQLSTEYGQAKKDGPVPAHRWRVVSKGSKQCASTTKGIVTHGSTDFGKVLTVCADDRCKVHHTQSIGGGSYKPSKEEIARQAAAKAKRTREEEIERRIKVAVIEKAPAKLRRKELERLALIALDGIYEEGDEEVLANVLGAETQPKKKKPGYARSGRHLESSIQKASDTNLQRFLVIAPLLTDHWIQKEPVLHIAARDYGVDVKAITRAVTAEAKAAAKPKPASGSAQKKRNATKPADGPACEICGCTELNACDNGLGEGCAWEPSFLKKQRRVCTTPACVKAAKKTKKKS